MEGDNERKFIQACSKGCISEVTALLEKVDPSLLFNLGFRNAASKGHAGVVDVLLDDSRVDPTACDNAALKRALEKHHGDIVVLLLSDNRVRKSLANTPLDTRKELFEIYCKSMDKCEAYNKAYNVKRNDTRHVT